MLSDDLNDLLLATTPSLPGTFMNTDNTHETKNRKVNLSPVNGKGAQLIYTGLSNLQHWLYGYFYLASLFIPGITTGLTDSYFSDEHLLLSGEFA